MRFSGRLGTDKGKKGKAQNGRQEMAVLSWESSAGNATKKPRKTTKSKGRARRERPSRKDGAERLRQAADKRLNEISERLADLLKTKALDGDLASAKALFGFAAGKKPIPEPVKKQRGLSYVEKLAREEQWVGKAEGEDYDWRLGNGDPDQRLGNRAGSVPGLGSETWDTCEKALASRL